MSVPDPVRFIETTLVDPETRRFFVLTDAERLFLRFAFELTTDGRLKYTEQIFSCPKKSGKTAFAAMVTLFVVRALGGRFAEAYCCANDFEQSQGRVYQATARIVQASPLLAADADVTQAKITFKSTGSTITALSSDYASAAGANPTMTTFDELWAYTSERAHRLWDEMVPPPTRQLALRLTVTYAGFVSESELLEGLYNRGIGGQPLAPDLYAAGNLLMFWSNEFTAPWQTEAWREQMRETSRPNAYLRLIENRWVTSESPFIDMGWYDDCTDSTQTPIIAQPELPVWIGVDASTKRDSTAIAAVAFDAQAQKVQLIAHRIFQPSPQEPLDFEATVEATLNDFSRRFRPVECRYDPYQMQATAQRLVANRVPMVEFAQTQANLTEASSNLYELFKGRNIVLYEDAAIRLATQRSIAVETSRGWRIAKEKTTSKIDIVVALAQAALAAIQSQTQPRTPWRRAELLVDGQPLPLRQRAHTLWATLAIDQRGAGICYWANTAMFGGWPCVLLDYQTLPLTPGLFGELEARLDEMARELGGYWTGPGSSGTVIGPILLADRVALEVALSTMCTIHTDQPHPDMFADRERLRAACALFIGHGHVKIARPAWERSRYAPPPLVDLRPDAEPSALLDAALLGVGRSLPDHMQFWRRLHRAA
jgi:hypothetical protein